MSVSIKIFKGQLLYMGKQIVANLLDHFLCRHYHKLIVAKSRRHSTQIKDPHSCHRRQKTFYISRQDKPVDDRFQQISPQNISSGADQHQKRHQKEHPLVSAKVVRQMSHSPF